MFTPGQKVACINADIPKVWLQFVQPLIKDNIYTIRDIVPGTRGNPNEVEISVYLVEITNSVNEHGIERGYNAERFTPLEYKTNRIVKKQKDLVPV